MGIFLTVCIFSLSLLIPDLAEANLLEVGVVCVPTATVSGPCHDCVCTFEGVFHCQRRQCYAVDLNQKRVTEECQPNYFYRENTTFCICSDEGHWRSDNCQENFRFLHPQITQMHYELRTNVICEPGYFYIIDCNICKCEASGFIDVSGCTNRYCSNGHKADSCNFGDVLRTQNQLCTCSDIHFYIDRLCVSIKSRPVQQINTDDLSKLVDVGKSWRRVSELLSNICNRDLVYTVDCNKCVCHDGALICTTNTCVVKRKIALRHEKGFDKTKSEFDSLPELDSITDRCIPGKTYRHKCYTCQCTKIGELKCATMMCLKDYVLDETALRGALSANATKVADLPEIHGGEKCVDGQVYRLDCNTCVCKNGVLICTKMACLGVGLEKNTGRKEINNGKKAVKREREPSKKGLVVTDKEFEKLPELSHHAAYCTPGKKYRVHCNVCLCNKNHILICDMKMCVNQDATRQIEAKKKSGKPCLDDLVSTKCIKCECEDGRTKCEAKPVKTCKSKDDNLMLAQNAAGSPRLTFNYKEQQCIPDVVYREMCNNCYCQPDRSLRCTRKMCLNYAQVMQLEKQRKYLVENGL